MAVVRLILVAASIATVLGLIRVAFVPASGRIIDIGAAIFALATWVVPPLLAAKSWNKKRSSLASVGFVIGLFVVAACLSVMGISLALLTLLFTKDANWAWPALLTIAAFWVSVFSLSYFGSPSFPDGQRSQAQTRETARRRSLNRAWRYPNASKAPPRITCSGACRRGCRSCESKAASPAIRPLWPSTPRRPCR